MEQDKKETKNSRAKTWNKGKGRKKCNNNSNNYQDKFAKREFTKGEDKVVNALGGKYPITTGSKDNDPSWYAFNPSLLRDVANLPFSYPLGYTWDLTAKAPNPFTNSDNQFITHDLTVPGVMQLQIAPTFGDCKSPTDALNIADVSLFNFVRHATSGSSRYEAPDLGMYLLALDSAYRITLGWLEHMVYLLILV